MALSAFIRSNIAPISHDWETFARTLLPDREFTASILRNGIVEILKEIADDMDQAQSPQQQQVKSEGEERKNSNVDDAAEKHALARVKMGLSSRQLISEFRALRASVLRLWQDSDPGDTAQDLYDMIRFNEAVDQALTEAAIRYTEKVTASRELFLGILAHDLRNPLGAIVGSAELLALGSSPERNPARAKVILHSAMRMKHLISDLSELARIQLGDGLTLNRTPCSISEICIQAVEEMRAIHSTRLFEVKFEQEITGVCDVQKLSQIFSNLLGNAVQHGSPDTAITIGGKSTTDGAEIYVHNSGKPIPEDMIEKLFDTFVRVNPGDKDGEFASSMGLGLYIAKQIAVAHGGTINVQSTPTDGITFTVLLPVSR